MNNLEELRKEINNVDDEMMKLFSKRMEIAKKIGLYKKENNLPVLDKNREEELIKKNLEKFNNKELEKYYEDFLKSVMDISKDYQRNLK